MTIARFPLDSALLPAQSEMTEIEDQLSSDHFARLDYREYIDGTVMMLTGASLDAFSPELYRIDSLIGTLFIPADMAIVTHP